MSLIFLIIGDVDKNGRFFYNGPRIKPDVAVALPSGRHRRFQGFQGVFLAAVSADNAVAKMQLPLFQSLNIP